MKKTVIAIWGNGDQGKSSSIKEIINRFKLHFPTAIFDYQINKGDISIIIIIGKIKIGIESQGDPPGTRMQKSLNLFVKEKCDIIICACRSSGQTVNIVDNLNNLHKYEIIWTSNYLSYEKKSTLLNEIFADHIIFLIQKIINGVI